MIRLDIVLVSYNTKDLTIACIESIFRFTKIPFRLILVDNASKDGTVESVMLKFLGVDIIANNTNEGYAKACNLGAKLGNNPYILFLNTDTEFSDAQWAQTMINVFEQDPKTAVVGPKLINRQKQITGCGVVGTNKEPSVRGWMEWDGPGKYDAQIECISICGACFMIKRSNIETLGLMDERYPFYFEETDYCYNAREKGYKCIYTPATTVYHFHMGSSQGNRKIFEWFKIGDAIFKEKWAHVMGDERRYG